jgi:hypothetical protein
MLNLLHEFFRAIGKVLLVVPMPWRADIIILASVLVGYQLLYHFSVLLLLPEFWLTNQLRLSGRKPLPGTYMFNSIIELSIKSYRVLRWVMLLVAVLALVARYSLQFVEDATLTQYINQMISWWDLLERKVLNGRQ